ncbi:hypothetical protein A2U01_0052670, partial [Trifolium medium]|nr:hypothetical protein [Trifolium medium]
MSSNTSVLGFWWFWCSCAFRFSDYSRSVEIFRSQGVRGLLGCGSLFRVG